MSSPEQVAVMFNDSLINRLGAVSGTLTAPQIAALVAEPQTLPEPSLTVKLAVSDADCVSANVSCAVSAAKVRVTEPDTERVILKIKPFTAASPVKFTLEVVLHLSVIN